MNDRVYDIFMLAGVVLIGTGVWQWSWPAALVTVGALLIVLTLIGSGVIRRRG